MRIVFAGAGPLAEQAARVVVRRGHDVVIIDPRKERIEELTATLDCGFLHGDGTRPAILREADPQHTDVLFCLSELDQDNIIAGLVGRSLGFQRVVTRIGDEEFEHVCLELGLDDAVIPDRMIGSLLADMVEGRNVLELSAALKGGARAFIFVARPEDEGTVMDLALPEGARATHLYRDHSLVLLDPDSPIHENDEVVVITHSKNLETLHERWKQD